MDEGLTGVLMPCDGTYFQHVYKYIFKKKRLFWSTLKQRRDGPWVGRSNAAQAGVTGRRGILLLSQGGQGRRTPAETKQGVIRYWETLLTMQVVRRWSRALEMQQDLHPWGYLSWTGEALSNLAEFLCRIWPPGWLYLENWKGCLPEIYTHIVYVLYVHYTGVYN